MMYEDEWDAPEVDDRNDWSYMEIGEDGHSPEPDVMVDIISPNPVTPIFGNNTIMPGTFPSSPPSPSYATSDSEFRVSSSSPETKVARSPRRNSYGSDEEVKMLLIEPQHPHIEPENENVDDSDPEIHWKRFEILPEAPRDHAFYSVDPAQPNKAFLARLSKEYRVLQSSLPDSILVRAYEDRTDLMRCLIMGPENTPYEDAPFVIDWRLDDTFPQSPPIAHFLSWTNGNGRVNPCVCLNA
jgi:ubiquitin-conjugating enzyme E2 O